MSARGGGAGRARPATRGGAEALPAPWEDREVTSTLPHAHYLLLSSRLIPGLDGGFTIASLARAAQMTAAGADSVQLVTFDPGAAADHEAHRAEFARQGRLTAPLRNIFDDAGDDRSWLLSAAADGERDAALEYRELVDGRGVPLLALPNVPDPSGWHLSTAPVVVYDAAGAEAGVLAGFGALYTAWLNRAVAALREAEERPVVVICESRQLGEILARDAGDDIRIVHAIHTMHVEAPFAPDAPLNGLWRRWFGVADRFDAVAWPTAAQRDDVAARFGGDNHFVVPNGVAGPAGAAPDAGARAPGRVVMVNRLAPGKRIDHAVRAFLAADVPGSRLEIWGTGPERDRLLALIDELGAADRVALHGLTDDVGRVLEQAALFVTSTAYEGQGLAIVEALAHGCPVVSYDIRYGPADALAVGGGLLVADGDEDALGDAIRTVLTEDALRDRLTAEAPAAAARFAPEAAMTALGAAVRAALAGPARR